ncbi:glycosyltransferase family 61 protein [Cellulosimicrobium marinum]|uniref:glycosyltransferase family 61 protein n=1 Tax=Cellulosimicrobium marinum TaxID=1638992 RepID=UPI001E314C4B|nr:glycosyltransferase 61 family protein [Cellulosimicrobium marinum]MCB7137652.1 glycosyltransferase family 61 protein [Cellulosimicrobium marinum]
MPARSTSLYVEHHEHWQDVVTTDRTLPGPLRVRTVEGATVLPLRPSTDGRHRWEGGVVDAHGEFVAGHRTGYRHATSRNNVVGAYPVPADVVHRPEVVIWGGGRDARHFGHFLTENLTRLWFWVENRGLGLRVAFVNNGLGHDHPNVELFHRLGLRREDLLFVEEPTRFDAVVVPDQALYLSGEMHLGHSRSTYDALRASVPPAGVDKVYLTRRHLTPKACVRDVNEEMLEDFFAAQGYEVVAPETLPLGEQIALMAGAREVACTLGTLSHQVLFCPDGVRLSVVLRDPHEPLPVQWSMNALRGARCSVVDASLSFLPSSHTAGVRYFTSTPGWSRFVAEQFGAVAPAAPPDEHLLDYVRHWTQVVAGTPARDLWRFPSWTVADLVASLSTSVVGAPLRPATRAKLTDRFGTSG